MKTPKEKLAVGEIYSGDNGRLMCISCAGMTPLFTGRDLSGKRLRKINATDNADWVEYFGRQIACECKKTTFNGGK